MRVTVSALIPAALIVSHGMWSLNHRRATACDSGFPIHLISKWERIIAWIIAFVVSTFILGHLCSMIWCASCTWWRCTSLINTCKRVYTFLRRLLDSRSCGHVDVVHQKLRLDFAGMVIPKIKQCLLIYFVVTGVEGNARGKLDTDFYFGSAWSLAALFSIVCVILDIARPRWTPATLDVANIVCSSLLGWRYLTMNREYYQYWAGFHWILRAMQGVTFGNACLSMALQCLLTVVDLYASANKCVEFEFLLVGQSLGNLVTLVVVGSIYWALQRAMQSTAEALVEARQSSNANISAHRLLAGMCDAVVSLDSDFNIALPCPKLAGLLLRRGLEDRAVTRCFLDFMPTEDQTRFIRFLTDEAKSQADIPLSVSDASPARVLHATLYDVNQTPVQVEMFTSFCGDGGPNGPCHLVGIIAAPTENIVIDSDMAALPFQNQVNAFPTICETTISTPSEVTSSSFATLCEDVQQQLLSDQREITLIIDTHSNDFRIVQCTSHFANLGGASSLDRDLREWFLGFRSWTRFVRFIGTLWGRDSEEGMHTDTLADVVLSPPSLNRSICIECTCRATREDRDPFEDTAWHVTLNLSKLKVAAVNKNIGHCRMKTPRWEYVRNARITL